MRHFRHLNQAEISQIIARYYAGETQTALADEFQIDRSTIHYHVDKYERAYPEQGGIYSVIKVETRRTCLHPSSRCSVCGEMWDQLARNERDEIERLTKSLAAAHSRLRIAGEYVE